MIELLDIKGNRDMIDYEDTFIAAGGAPGCSDTSTPLDDCLIIGGYVLGDTPDAGLVMPVFEEAALAAA